MMQVLLLLIFLIHQPANIILDKFHFQAMAKMVGDRWLSIKSNTYCLDNIWLVIPHYCNNV